MFCSSHSFEATGEKFPAAVAGRNDLHERKALAGHRIFERLADRTLALAHVGGRMHALARDEGGTVEVRHHLGDLVGIAVQARVTAVGRRRGLHTQQGSRGHLAARHAVNGVVDIDRHDVLAACGRVDRLRRADGRQVAVALVGEDQIAGMEPFHGRSYGQGASVGGLDPVDVDIIVCEYGAAHGRNAYGLFFESPSPR